MKKTFYLLGLLFLLLPVLQSCDNDYDVVGKDWATVRTTGSGGYYLEGDTWGIIDPISSPPWFKAVDGDRVLTYFEPLDDTEKGVQAKMEGIQEILTKRVEEMTAENEAEFGNDPILIYEGYMWLGGKYLNIVFRQDLPRSEKHLISLVQNKIASESQQAGGNSPIIDEAGYVNLDLRYNTYNDITDFRGWGRVSFNLTEFYPSEANTDLNLKGFKVTINSKEHGKGRVIRLDLDYPVGIPEAAKGAHSTSLLQ